MGFFIVLCMRIKLLVIQNSLSSNPLVIVVVLLRTFSTLFSVITQDIQATVFPKLLSSQRRAVGRVWIIKQIQGLILDEHECVIYARINTSANNECFIWDNS